MSSKYVLIGPLEFPSRPYVYDLIDPRDAKPFYVGKGTRNRPLAHITEAHSAKPINLEKAERIRSILDAGLPVHIEIITTLNTDSEAYAAESKRIADLRDGGVWLTNIAGRNEEAGPRDLRVLMHEMLWTLLRYRWRHPTQLSDPELGYFVSKNLVELWRLVLQRLGAKIARTIWQRWSQTPVGLTLFRRMVADYRADRLMPHQRVVFMLLLRTTAPDNAATQ